MAYPYTYGGYPNGYYAPPMQDQLGQLRANAYQPQIMNQPMAQNQNPMQTVQNQIQQNATAVSPQQGQPSSMTGPVFVNGDAGAKGFLVAPGNTVMLIDADPDANTFWLKSADASGMPSMRTFDYTERINPKSTQIDTQTVQIPKVEYVTKSEFDALSARAEELAAELEELKAKKSTPVKKSVKEDEENG